MTYYVPITTNTNYLVWLAPKQHYSYEPVTKVRHTYALIEESTEPEIEVHHNHSNLRSCTMGDYCYQLGYEPPVGSHPSFVRAFYAKNPHLRKEEIRDAVPFDPAEFDLGF